MQAMNACNEKENPFQSEIVLLSHAVNRAEYYFAKKLKNFSSVIVLRRKSTFAEIHWYVSKETVYHYKSSHKTITSRFK
jgi:hypothetical protein